MSEDVIVVDLVAELQENGDFLSKRAADEIMRLRGVIARNCDMNSAVSDGDRAIIEVVQKQLSSNSK